MYLKDLLKYRNAWLGFAMIWIVFFHAAFNLDFILLKMIKATGYGGVDICLFASGAGCFYSLSKDSNIGSFIKRRFSRIAPTYLCFMLFWLIYKAFLKEISLPMAIGNILGIQAFTGQETEFNWYISAIILLYFLAPYLKKCVDILSLKNQAIVLMMLVLLSVPFWFVNTHIIMVTRIPIFYLGMVFGNLCKQNKQLTRKTIAITIGATIIGFMALCAILLWLDNISWSTGLLWYPFILITPGICLIISGTMMLFEKKKILSKIKGLIEVIGKNSFEVFLVHLPLIDIISKIIGKFGLEKYKYVVWLAGVVLLVMCCALLKKFTTLISSIVIKKKKVKGF